jgi:hypothetical protein
MERLRTFSEETVRNENPTNLLRVVPRQEASGSHPKSATVPKNFTKSQTPRERVASISVKAARINSGLV